MDALRQMGEIALRELSSATEETFVRAALGLVAMWKKQIVWGSFAAYSDEECSELLIGQTETKH